jgi:hypothetical protein
MKSSTEVTEGAMVGAAATSITIAQAGTTTSGVLLEVATAAEHATATCRTPQKKDCNVQDCDLLNVSTAQ